MRESEKVIEWIKDYFEKNGKGCKAIIGISGGTDSSVVAALLVRALGKENVVGVLMPNGRQHDIDMSYALVSYLDIPHYEINIEGSVNALRKSVEEATGIQTSDKPIYYTNTPARIRMSVLYGVSALLGGRVANTCNLSEDYIGYSTKFGDAAGDFSPISDFTKTEVRELGRELGLPEKFIVKIPEDGMSGMSDEEKLGFTYATLDRYIRTGEIDDLAIKERIERLHKANLHKLLPMPRYERDA